jgi:hypothetical protein
VHRRNADEVAEQDEHTRAGRSHLSNSGIFAIRDDSNGFRGRLTIDPQTMVP